jgi:hypothetical protein
VKGELLMPEIISPYDEFKKFLEEYSNDNWFEFGYGLIVVFGDKKVNIRQYHNDGFWLSSWVDKEEFFERINQFPVRESLKINEEENNNE